MKNNQDEDKPNIHKKICPNCGKKFFSLSKRQLEYNYISHIGSCDIKKKGVKK